MIKKRSEKDEKVCFLPAKKSLSYYARKKTYFSSMIIDALTDQFKLMNIYIIYNIQQHIF